MKLPLIAILLACVLGYATPTVMNRKILQEDVVSSASVTSNENALGSDSFDASLPSSLWLSGTSWLRRALGGKTTIYITIYGKDKCDDDEEEDEEGRGGKNKCKDDEDDEEEEEEEEEVEVEEIDSIFVPEHLEACSEDGIDASDTSTAQVTWNFWVETNTRDTSGATENVCSAMSTLVAESIRDNHCASSARRRRHLRASDRRLEIQAYGKKIKCTFVGDCEPTIEESENCGVYEAEQEVVYDEEGEENTSESEVSETVTSVAEEVITDDGFGSEVGDEAVTFVGFGIPKEEGDPTAGLVGSNYEDTSSQGLTTAGKAAIAAASALVALLLLLCYFCWRRNRNRDLDSKSIDTDDTATMPGRGGMGGGGSLGSDGDDMSYRTSDFNNLGLHHSKLDVHRCTSSTCTVCNPPNAAVEVPGVFFIGSGGGAPLSDIVEEEIKSNSGRSASEGEPKVDGDVDENKDTDDFDDDVPPPPPPPPLLSAAPGEEQDEQQPKVEKKGRFSRIGRKSKSFSTPEAEPIARGTTNITGSVGNEVEMEI